jgi:hypothetical protein
MDLPKSVCSLLICSLLLVVSRLRKEEFLSSKPIGMEVEGVLGDMKNRPYIDYRTMIYLGNKMR